MERLISTLPQAPGRDCGQEMDEKNCLKMGQKWLMQGFLPLYHKLAPGVTVMDWPVVQPVRTAFEALYRVYGSSLARSTPFRLSPYMIAPLEFVVWVMDCSLGA